MYKESAQSNLPAEGKHHDHDQSNETARNLSSLEASDYHMRKCAGEHEKHPHKQKHGRISCIRRISRIAVAVQSRREIPANKR